MALDLEKEVENQMAAEIAELEDRAFMEDLDRMEASEPWMDGVVEVGAWVANLDAVTRLELYNVYPPAEFGTSPSCTTTTTINAPWSAEAPHYMEEEDMMQNLGINSTMTFTVGFLRGVLADNRAQHERIYKESLAGYLRQAEKKLREATTKVAGYLAQIEAGEHIPLHSIHFGLEKPEHHLEAYDTVIQMLKHTTDEELELGPDEYRMLVMDEWEWQRGFLMRNAVYSMTGGQVARAKGYIK